MNFQLPFRLPLCLLTELRDRVDRAGGRRQGAATDGISAGVDKAYVKVGNTRVIAACGHGSLYGKFNGLANWLQLRSPMDRVLALIEVRRDDKAFAMV